MAKQLFSNDAATTLSGSLSQGGTTLVVASGTGSFLPAISGDDYFYLSLFEKDLVANEERSEIVKVTARTADTLTIVRDIEEITGQGGGFAYPSEVGKTVYIELRLTAGGANNLLQSGDIGVSVAADADLQAHLAATDNPHAATAAQVGAMATSHAANAITGLGASGAATTVARSDHAHTKADIGLGSVDNTADAAKPVSTAQAAADAAVLAAAAPVGHVGAGGAAHSNAVAAGDAGFMTGADKTKLDGIATGATANVGDVTLAGVQTLTNKTITEIVYTLTGTTPALSATNGAIQTWTLTANSTPTDSLATGQSIILMIQDGTAYSITWPSVVWTKAGGSGTAPTLNATVNTCVVLWKVGSTLYGSYLGDA